MPLMMLKSGYVFDHAAEKTDDFVDVTKFKNIDMFVEMINAFNVVVKTHLSFMMLLKGHMSLRVLQKRQMPLKTLQSQ